MAQRLINIGSSPNKGDGDPLRTAFDKINNNFTELYTREENTGSQTLSLVGNTLSISGGNSVVLSDNSTGSVFGIDSTILVDTTNSSINLDGTVKGNIVPDTDVAYDLGSATNRFRDLYLSGNTIDLGGTTLSISGGTLEVGGSPVISQSDLTGYVTQAELSAGSITVNPTGDLKGSVFADDSTLLVDAVAGKIVGPVETTDVNVTGNVTLSGITYTTQIKSNEQLIINAGGGPINTVQIGTGSNVLIGTTGKNIDFGGPANFGLYDITVGTVQGNLNGNVTGDLTGSVFADDSTLLVDSVSGLIPYSVIDGSPTALSDFTNDLDYNAIVATQIQTNGLPTGTEASGLFASSGQSLVLGYKDSGGTAWSHISLSESNNIQIQADVTVAAATTFNFSNATVTGLNVVSQGLTYVDPGEGGQTQVGLSADIFDFGTGNIVDLQGNSVLFDGATVTGLPTPNNSGIAYQLGYSAHDAVSIADGVFSVNAVDMVVSLTASNNAQGVRIDISGVTTGTSAGTGPIYVERRVNGGGWLTWSAFIVKGADDHFNHSFVDFYDTGGTGNDVVAEDTVEYRLSNGTTNSSFSSQVSGPVEFELFWGFNFTATEVPLSYTLIQP